MSGSAKRSITVSLDGSNKSSSLPLIDGTIGPSVADIRKLYGDLGHLHLRSRLRRHRIVREQDHLHRWRRRRAAVSRLSDRAARGEIKLPRDLLPAAERRTAERQAARGVRTRRHAAHHAARAAPHVLQRLPPRRASDGGDVRRGRRAVGVLSRQPRHPRPGEPPHQRVPADRQGADDRCLGAQVFDRPAVHLSAQRPLLRRELPAHVPRRAGGAVQGQSGAVACDGPDHDPARRS